MDKKDIVLVDDQRLLREGIKALLEKDSSYRVIAEAGSVKEALKLLKEIKADLIIMEIAIPEMDAITNTQEIINQHKNIPVLILTMLGETQIIRTLIKTGIKGYLLKSAGKAELLKAVEEVIQGGTYFCEAVSKAFMTNFVSRIQFKSQIKNHIPITERELDILDLIVKEYTNQEIAHSLSISIRTVDAHRRNLLEKLGARNTAGLVKYAIEHRLLQDK